MAFFKGVNLVGPKQEKLSGWINERFAEIGVIVHIKEDEYERPWTVAEVGDQLVKDALVDERAKLDVIIAKECEAAHETVKRPRKLKAAATVAE